MRLAIVLMALLWAAAPASAQTVSVSGEGALTTITADGLEVRAVLEAASFALNVPRISRASRSARVAGSPAFPRSTRSARTSATAAWRAELPASRWGRATTSCVKRNQGAHEPFDVTASLGGGSDTLMFAGPGVHGSDSIDGGSGRDGISYALCTCPDGVTAASQRVRGARRLARAGHADRARPRARPPTSRSSRAAPATTRSQRSTASPSGSFCGPGNDHAIAEAGDTVSSDCERVDLFAGAPVIGSGPSGIVGSSSARFEFALVGANPPPGRFECALDGGSFTPCTSPVELSGLAEGEHVFAVRYHADGSDPGRGRGAAMDGGHGGAAGDLRRRAVRRGQPGGSADRVPFERAGRGDVPVQPRCRAGGGLLEPASAGGARGGCRTASRCRRPTGPATRRCRSR